MKNWILPPRVRAELAADGQRRFPEEACGLLFGSFTGEIAVIERYLPVRNVADAPLHTFEVDPPVWVRSCFDPQLIGIYHTHPTSPPLPSPEDLRQLPNFAARIHLYLIGSSSGTAGNKPPGEPDGYTMNAYAVESRGGMYVLRAMPSNIMTDH